MNSRAPGITFGFTRVNSILERNKRAVGETFVGREQCARGMPCRVSLMHFNGNIPMRLGGNCFLIHMCQVFLMAGSDIFAADPAACGRNDRKIRAALA